MDSERISSAAAATATAINRTLENINNQQDVNQATQLRILNLEKLLLCQQQTSKQIINQLKPPKDSKGCQHGTLTSYSNPFLPQQESIIDLTTTLSKSQNSELHPITHIQKKKKSFNGTTQHPLSQSTIPYPHQVKHSHLPNQTPSKQTHQTHTKHTIQNPFMNIKATQSQALGRKPRGGKRGSYQNQPNY
jgi:hypothetical protein